MPDSPLAGLTPEARKLVLDLLRDQKVTLASRKDGTGLRFDIAISKELLDKLSAIIRACQGGPRPAPPK